MTSTILTAPLIDRDLTAPEKSYILTGVLVDRQLSAPEREFSSVLFPGDWTTDTGDDILTNTGVNITFNGYSRKIITITAPLKLNGVTAQERP